MRTILLGSFLLLAACHEKVQSGGITVYAATWRQTQHELKFRAGPDLGCPVDAVTFTLAAKQGRIPTAVYAEGCGRSALYQRLLRRHGITARPTDSNTVWKRMN